MSSIGGFNKVSNLAPVSDVEEAAAPEAAAAPAAPAPATSKSGAAPALSDRNAVMAKLATLPPEVEPSRAEALAAAGKVDPKAVDADVEVLFKAMKGFGTDEAKIFKTLDGKSVEHRMAVQDRFAELHSKEWVTLRAALKDELSGKELDKALKLLDEGAPSQVRGEIMKDAGTSSGFMKAVRHFGVWFSFGLASKDIPNDPPRLTGADIKNDMLPNLKPGDIILCGNHGGLTHAIFYEGDGKIIHSMDSEETGQSVLQRIGETFKEPFDTAAEKAGKKESKVGVIEEGAAEFFDRFERDTYVVLRSPGMTPEKAAIAVADAKANIGKGYDHDFRPGNEEMYCSEVVTSAYRAALGDEAPRIGARPQHVPLLLDREAIVDPLDIFESPDLQVATASKSANLKFDLATKTEKHK